MERVLKKSRTARIVNKSFTYFITHVKISAFLLAWLILLSLWMLPCSFLDAQKIFALFVSSTLLQSDTSAGGAGLPATAVLQCLQKGPLPVRRNDGRADSEALLGELGHAWSADVAGGSRRHGEPAQTAHVSLRTGGRVIIRGRREPALHLRASGMGGGNTGSIVLYTHQAQNKRSPPMQYIQDLS